MAEGSVEQIAHGVPANPADLNDDGYDDDMEIAEIAKRKENLNRSLGDVETEFDCDSSAQRAATGDQVAGTNASAMVTSRLIEKLDGLQVAGRLAFPVAPAAKEPPHRRTVHGDALSVSPQPSNVGGFGIVFKTGSHLHRSGARATTICDWLAAGTLCLKKCTKEALSSLPRSGRKSCSNPVCELRG
jgi:hypothetical protein